MKPNLKRHGNEVYVRYMRIRSNKYIPNWLSPAFEWLKVYADKILRPMSLPHWSLDLLVALPRVLFGIYFPFMVMKYIPETGIVEAGEIGAFFNSIFSYLPVDYDYHGFFRKMSFILDGIILTLGLNSRFTAAYLLWIVYPFISLSFLWIGFLLTLIMVIIVGSGKYGVDFWIFRIPFLKKYLA